MRAAGVHMPSLGARRVDAGQVLAAEANGSLRHLAHVSQVFPARGPSTNRQGKRLSFDDNVEGFC